MLFPARVLLCLCLFPFVVVSAAEIELVADFNINGGGIQGGAVLGERLFFPHNDGEHGIELWVSDGSPEQTRLFADLVPGGASSRPRHLAVVDGRLWFAADAGDGHEVWVSDGTVAGTRQVRDIAAGAASSAPSDFGPVAGGVLFFAEDEQGREPWFSDGSASGTHRVRDINAGAASSVAGDPRFDPRVWGQFGDRRVFTADDGVHGVELWISDGSDVTMIEDRNDSNAFFFGRELVQAGSALFFKMDDRLHATDGERIWQVGDLAIPRDLVALGDECVCVVDNKELWRSDGSEPHHIHSDELGILDLAAVDGRLYFRGTSPDGGGGELWIGDRDGAAMLADLWEEGGSEPRGFTSLGDGRFVFIAKGADGGSPAAGYRLFVSDGSVGGTGEIANPDPAGVGFDREATTFLGSGEGRAYLVTAFGSAEGILMGSDGSAAGSEILAEPAFGPASSSPRDLVALGGAILGLGDPQRTSNLDAADEHVLAADPTLPAAEAGHTVADLFPGVAQAVSGQAGVIAGTAWFSAGNEKGKALWISDGQPGGTRRIGERFASHFRDLGDGSGLFVEDGSLFRVVSEDDDPAASISQVSGPSDPQELLVLDGRCYFTATGSGAGRELWIVEEGAARLLVDVHPSGDGLPERSHPSQWHQFRSSGIVSDGDGSRLFFAADDGSGMQLWRCDLAGEEAVALTAIGGGDAAIGELVSMGETLFFTAEDDQGRELWASNGEVGDGHRVADINDGASSSDPAWLTPVGDRLFFVADDGSRGRELWVSDGTADGTRIVRDIDDSHRSPEQLVAVNGICCFVYEDDELGEELWRSDGSATGTRMVQDLHAGPLGSEPFTGDRINALVVGDTLYFPARQPAVGRELFAFTPDPVSVAVRTITVAVQPARPGLEAVWNGLHRSVPATFTVGDTRPDRIIDLVLVSGDG